MKYIYFFAVGIILLATIGYGAMTSKNNGTEIMQSNTVSAPQTNTVTIQNFAFTPATITIKSGDQITWTNQDSMGHSATADDGSFDTGILGQNSTKTITFSKPGTFLYHCSVHPNMKATIIVQ